jgi:hypothetical protein
LCNIAKGDEEELLSAKRELKQTLMDLKNGILIPKSERKERSKSMLSPRIEAS